MYDFYETLFKAFSPSLGKSNHHPEPLKIRLINRIAMANTIPIPNPLKPEQDPYKSNNSLSLKGLLNEQTWIKRTEEDPKFSKDASTHVILGKYDAIVVRPITIPCRCILHTFDPDKTKESPLSEEKFISYFSRREIALQIDLDNEFYSKNVFYISSITLQRRSMRLGFLYSLLNIKNVSNNEPKSGDEYKENLSNKTEIGILLQERKDIKIRVYLSDGWNDLQIFFSTKSSDICEGDLKWAFKLQKALFQDFMVDHSEMLLTPRCLDAAYKCSDYTISIHTSIHKDGWLEKSADCYINHLRDNKQDGFNITSTHQTPGRTDFKMELTNNSEDSEHKTGHLYPKIMMWLDSSTPNSKLKDKPSALQLTDQIETYIEQIQLLNK